MGFRKIRPPDDGELLAYLDGEVSPGRRTEIEQMIESSWEVRTRLAAIERDVSVFVAATNPAGRPFPKFDDLWAPVQAEAAAAPQLSAASTMPWLARNRRKLATAAAAACLLMAVIAKLNTPAAVSAKVLLVRARQTEAREIAQVRTAVVYQKLRIQRRAAAPYRSESVVLELWRPIGGGPVQERLARQDDAPRDTGGRDVYSDFRRICAANAMDATRPLSPETFEGWQARANARWGKVVSERLPGGDRVYVLEAVRDQARADEILRAALVVREHDSHPVAHRLRVRAGQGAEDYELAEDAYRVVAMTSLPRSLFPQPVVRPEAAPAQGEAGVLPPPEPVRALPPVPAGELAASAVEVHFVLHRLGLCQQEFLELNRTASGIELRGAADSEDQKRSIAAALGHVPHVHFDMAVRERPGRTSVPEHVKSVLDGYLERKRDADVPALRDSVLALNNAVSADARALRRLARTFSSEDLAALPIASRWLLNQIFHDHLTALRKNSGQLGSLLLPVLERPGASSDDVSEAVSPPDWRSQLVSFCDRVELACGLLRTVAAGSSQPPDSAVRRFAGVLADTPSDAAALEVAFTARLTAAGGNSPAVQENSR